MGSNCTPVGETTRTPTGLSTPSHPVQSRLLWGALPLAIAQTDGRQGDDFEALDLEWLAEYNLGGVHPFQLFDALTQRWVEGRRVRHAPHSREEAQDRSQTHS